MVLVVAVVVVAGALPAPAASAPKTPVPPRIGPTRPMKFVASRLGAGRAKHSSILVFLASAQMHLTLSLCAGALQSTLEFDACAEEDVAAQHITRLARIGLIDMITSTIMFPEKCSTSLVPVKLWTASNLKGSLCPPLKSGEFKKPLPVGCGLKVCCTGTTAGRMIGTHRG